MNILFTCHEYPPFPSGGLGIFISEFAPRMHVLGNKVYVYGIYNDIKQRHIELDRGVVIIRDPFFKGVGIIAEIRKRIKYAKRIRELVQQYSIDIIEAHDTGGWFWFIKSKVVVRLHNGERYFKKRGVGTRLLETASFLYKPRTIIAVSSFILDKFRCFFFIRNPFHKYKIIHNGIEIQSYNEIALQKKIVFAGTLKPIKGIDTLLKAFILSDLAKHDIVLELYGKDTRNPDGSSYKDVLINSVEGITEFIKEGKIAFLGHQPKHLVNQAFSKALFCVFPSILESFGLVTIEAMAQKRPVIYTKQGEAKEIITDTVDGFLVAPGNVEELADIMLKLVNSEPEYLKQIGENARDKVIKKFNIENNINKSLTIYSALCK